MMIEELKKKAEARNEQDNILKSKVEEWEQKVKIYESKIKADEEKIMNLEARIVNSNWIMTH